MSISIGSINIETPVFLAPMSGVTDLPFRHMVKRFGAGLVFSEMLASRPMVENARRMRKTRECFDFVEEHPLAIQIAGCEPDVVAEAARICEERGAQIIDLNFGCPVKKIVNNMGGSALMRDEPLAIRIIEDAVKAVGVPVTVKMRLGWDHDSINAPRLAEMAENVGVKMITVHGRTRNQLYTGQADWDAIREVKSRVRIPVIVNGDILTPHDASLALEKSGADGVMIGRGAYGKPWVVKQVMDHLSTGQHSPAPSGLFLRDLVLDHYDALISHYGVDVGVKISRKHIGWYIQDLRNSEFVRSKINASTVPDDVKNMIFEFFETL